MELILIRSYYPNGTNGKLYYDKQFICYTIELPWLQNRRNVSCIPEGIYQVVKRNTAERGDHLYLVDVPDRSWILLHPANNALKELKGCIAPVSKLDGPGVGSSSRQALEKIEGMILSSLDQNEEVFLTIKHANSMNLIDRVKAPTPKFFKLLRNIGLTLAAAGGAIIASPITLPAGIITFGGYLIAGGGVLSAVSQATVEEKNED